MSRRPASVVASLVTTTSLISLHAGAQAPELPTRLPWSSTTRTSIVARVTDATRPPSPSVVVPEEKERWSLAHSVGATAVGVGGGALLGGWLGYFVSQVGRSDWDKLPNADKSRLRRQYAISGASVGAVLGYFLRPRPRPVAGLPQPPALPPRVGRQLIAGAELRRTVATNALEVVELDRPEWIKNLHDDEARNGRSDTTTAIEARSVVVYVGEERVGSIESLRDIAVPEITELRFYDARDAGRRWGGEYRYGAIEVIPVPTPVGEAAGPTAARP